jgi:predicted O-methyltransferase YrrM
MNPILSELIQSGVSVSENGKVHRVHSHIPTEEGLFLESTIAEIKPQVSVEVGLGFGISALFICEALSRLPNARHIVIDPHQRRSTATHISFECVGLDNLRKAGYEHLIEFHDASSHLALPALVSQGTKVDFAFIDGWHTFDFASTDFFYIDLLLRPGGVVVLDDTYFPSVWKLCRYIVTNRAYSVVGCVPLAEDLSSHPLRRLAARVSHSVTRNLWRATHSDKLVPLSRCIAFRKEAEDSRSWDFHQDF